MKEGRKPIEKKPSKFAHFFSKKLLEVPKHLAEELKAQGLEARWINGEDYKANGGMHRDGWRPYVRKAVQQSADELALGEWGEAVGGVVRRKDLILGVRPIEMGYEHR